jgi:CSLREA domain-containing protein
MLESNHQSIRARNLFRNASFVLILLVSFALAAPPTAFSAVQGNLIQVTTDQDEFDTSGSGSGCSLREAIQSANTNSAFGGCSTGSGSIPDTIELPSTTYYLTLAGSGEDANATGDLDIASDLEIIGNPQAIISGNRMDRVFHIHSGIVLMIDLQIKDGKAPDGTPGAADTNPGGSGGSGQSGSVGGGIYNIGTLTIQDSEITENFAGNGGAGGAGFNGLTASSFGSNGGNGSTGGDGGAGGGGGGIYNYGTLTVIDSSINNNFAGTGGAGGSGGSGGRGWDGVDILNRQNGTNGGIGGRGGAGGTGGAGGGIFNYVTRSVTIIDSTISNNQAGAGGRGGHGGDGGNGGDGYDQFTDIGLVPAGDGGNGNSPGRGHFGGAGGQGGGLYNWYDSPMTIDNSLIYYNEAGDGGASGNSGTAGDGGDGGNTFDYAVPCDAGDAGDAGSGVIANYSGIGGHGGGINNHGTLDITESAIYYNTTGSGGSGGKGGDRGAPGTPGATYDNSCDPGQPGAAGTGGNGAPANNGGNGAGIHQETYSPGSDPSLDLWNSSVFSNTAAAGGNGGGGGAGNGNGGDGGDAGNGGGIHISDGTAKINNSTLSSNHADQPGGTGGGSGAGSGSNGSPGASGNGAGLYNYSSISIQVKNSTIAKNIAGNNGGGLLSNTFNVTVGHSVLADNMRSFSVPNDCSSKFHSEDYNLLEASDCSATGVFANSIFGSDPNLGSLGLNGGSTQNHALLPGSVAIDAGANICTDSDGYPFTQDQRGMLRPQDASPFGSILCDIGSYEADGFLANIYLPSALKNHPAP